MFIFIECFRKMCEKLNIYACPSYQREDVRQLEVKQIFVIIFGSDFTSITSSLIESLNQTYPVDSLTILECFSLRLVWSIILIDFLK